MPPLASGKAFLHLVIRRIPAKLRKSFLLAAM
jgi:hypothetical protein